MLEKSKRSRAQILDAANEIFEVEQRRGYQEGREEAKIEQTVNMVSIVSQTLDYLSKIELQIVDLVLKSVRRITEDFSDKEKILSVVKMSLSLVRSQQQLRVFIHPENFDFIQTQINNLIEKYPSIEQLDIVPDASLPKDACIVDSEIGRVEASISGQISALKSSFQKVFGSDI